VVTCRACGTENPDGFRLCGMCGASLVGAPPERRKVATLLFCDLSGSTAMGERLDPESVRDLMFRFGGRYLTMNVFRSAFPIDGCRT
jgi:hypothetical protein